MKPIFKLFVVFLVTILLSSLFLGHVKEGILSIVTTDHPNYYYNRLELSGYPNYQKLLIDSYNTNHNAAYKLYPIDSPYN
uniref:Uncharacterized protein n=1 Tax=viral metagenome TaxID=1070528 RepID=A0A6C0JGA8_9ZZZZ